MYIDSHSPHLGYVSNMTVSVSPTVSTARNRVSMTTTSSRLTANGHSCAHSVTYPFIDATTGPRVGVSTVIVTHSSHLSSNCCSMSILIHTLKCHIIIGHVHVDTPSANIITIVTSSHTSICVTPMNQCPVSKEVQFFMIS